MGEKNYSESQTPNLVVAVRTLVTGGFILEDVQRNPGYALLLMKRVDEFGAVNKYVFAVAESEFSQTEIEAIEIYSHHHQSQIVLIGDGLYELPIVQWERFVNLFGGPVYTTYPLEPEFSEHLNLLGHNQLPDGLQGSASDLFEEYVRIGLEFIFAGRVIRYGQERQFEKRPDGIALPNWGFTALFDSKAYKKGYVVSVDTVRQFKDYVEDFSKRYKTYLPRLNAFIVVSGEFPHRTLTLESRSRDLLAACGVPLAFLTTNEFVQIIKAIAGYPSARRSLDWGRIFSDPITTSEKVRIEIEAVRKDGILSRR